MGLKLKEFPGICECVLEFGLSGRWPVFGVISTDTQIASIGIGVKILCVLSYFIEATLAKPFQARTPMHS